jgi:ABC-2 type transport system permease protein
MRAIILRIIKQMWNDKPSLAMILFAPVLIISLMYLIFGESSYTPKVTAVGLPVQMVDALRSQDVTLSVSDKEVDLILEDRSADAVIYLQGNVMKIKMYEPDSIKIKAVTKAVMAAAESISGIKQGTEVTFLYGNNEKTTFDSLGYMFLGVFSFFFVFLIAGISFIRERTRGTIERFMLTPVSRLQAVSGFILGFGIFAVAQSVIIVFYTKYVLSLNIAGSVFSVIAVMVLIAFAAVAMGAVVSVFARNEFQVVQFIPIVIVPQIFFSGFIPIDTLPYGLGWLAYLMPVYYGSSGLKEIMVKGSDLPGILPYCLALSGFIVLLFSINIVLLKKYRVN